MEYNYDLIISLDGEDKKYPLPMKRDKLPEGITKLMHELTWTIKNALLLKLVKDGRMAVASCDVKIQCESNTTLLKVIVSKNAPCGIEDDLKQKVEVCIIQIERQICRDIIFSEKFIN